MTKLDEIKRLNVEIMEREQQITAIRAACHHDWKPSNPEWLDASSPRCVLCGEERSGWWCEESPTKECDYFDPKRARPYQYNSDQCRYCGNPSERK